MIPVSPMTMLYAFVAGCNILLAAAILATGIRNRVNASFASMTGFIVIWMVSAYCANYFTFIARDMGYASLYTEAAYFAAIPLPSLFLYFVSIYPNNTGIGMVRSCLITAPVFIFWWFLASGSIVKGVVFQQGNAAAEAYGPMIWAFAVYFTSFFILGFYVLLQKLFRLRGFARIQVSYVFAGCIIPVLVAGLTNLFLPLAGITSAWDLLHRFSPLSTIFFTVFVSISILRHRFMGFNMIMAKGAVYTVIAAAITAMYFSSLIVLARYFSFISGNYSGILGLLFFFLFAIIFEPIRDRLQAAVDRVFFKDRLDYEKTLKEISTAMSVMTEAEKLLKLAARLITRRMRLTGAALFMYDEKHDRFEAAGTEGSCLGISGSTISPNYPLIEYLEEKRSPVSRTDVEMKLADVFLPESEKARYLGVLKDMENIGAALIIPSMFKNRIVAFFALGQKRSGDMFNDDDINFLGTLSNQSAVFVENVKLLENEKEAIRLIAEAEARDKYTQQLEAANRELLETREELVKSERLSMVTRLSVSLQHEINNPLTSVLAQTQALLLKLDNPLAMQKGFLRERMSTIEREARRIRELLRNLATITEPIVREYMPGVEMIDIGGPSTGVV